MSVPKGHELTESEMERKDRNLCIVCDKRPGNDPENPGTTFDLCSTRCAMDRAYRIELAKRRAQVGDATVIAQERIERLMKKAERRLQKWRAKRGL
jgi:hypothetical protein